MKSGQREYFEGECDSRLNYLIHELVDLESLAANEAQISKVELPSKLEVLHLNLASAARKTSQLKAASLIAWPFIKQEIERMLFELEASFKNIHDIRNSLLIKKSHEES